MEVIVYSKAVCPFCVQAKNVLKKHNIAYREVSLDNDEAKLAFSQLVGPSVRTVPQIFVDGVRIGGYQELLKSDLLKNSDGDFPVDF